MKKHYVMPNNVHDTEAGMPEYCMFYDAAEVDTRVAELEEALRTYGGHKELCRALIGRPCDCGFSKLMETCHK